MLKDTLMINVVLAIQIVAVYYFTITWYNFLKVVVDKYIQSPCESTALFYFPFLHAVLTYKYSPFPFRLAL